MNPKDINLAIAEDGFVNVSLEQYNKLVADSAMLDMIFLSMSRIGEADRSVVLSALHARSNARRKEVANAE